MAIQTFVTLSAQYDPAIAQGVNQIVASAISGNADTVTEALTLYVICIGALMSFREMTWPNFVKHALRAGAIAFLMTAAGFNQLIATPAMETIPQWIAQTTNAQTAVNSGAMQFELIWSATRHQEAAILQQATGIENLGYRIEAAFFTYISGVLLMVAFFIYEFSRAIMGLLVATLPFVLCLYLFEATRGIPMGIFKKGIGILILQLMLSIMLQIMLKGDAYILAQAANATGGLDEQLALLEDLCIFFFFGVGMVLFIPSIAAYIGGGIALNVGGKIANIAMAGVSMGRGMAGTAGRAGRRALQSARRM